MRLAIVILSCLALSACGMAKAVNTGAKTFDKYGCMAKDFKGQPPCEAEEPGMPQP